MNRTERGELRWVLTWAAVIALFSSLPYLWGMFITPPGHTFLGLTHNIDDGAVYLSWMRQAADGHFFIRNLFTNEPQAALQFNVLFLAMGWFAAITHLPLITVFHLSRIALGIALILAIWQFSKLFLDDPRQRRLLIPLVGLSAGIGWMIPGAKAPLGSVDVWQPEAITFLSIYLNPLFIAGLLLMLGSFYWLELARREGKAKYAVLAGLHLLVLGNVHTYDVLTVACVWLAHLLALTLAHFRFKIEDFRLARTLGLSALAALIALPSVAYQFHVYAIDPIYRLRANTPIPSPPILSYLEGYGLILLGAILGMVLLVRSRNTQYSILNTQWLLPIAWSVVGFAIPYIPIAQQRKLVMGLHIPLCILCAYALVAIVDAFRALKTEERGLTSIWAPRVVELRIVLLSVLFWMFVLISPLNFIVTDVDLLNQGRTATIFSPYMADQSLAAMRYLRTHAKPTDTVYAPPDISLFTPAMTGLAVYYGHWSETPDYRGKLLHWAAGANRDTPEPEGLGILLESKSAYLVAWGDESAYQFSSEAKSKLANVFRAYGKPEGSIAIYRVIRPPD